MGVKRSSGTVPGFSSTSTAPLFENTISAATASGSAYATKGNTVRPVADMVIHALTYFGNIINGATYRAYVIEYTGTTAGTTTGGIEYTAVANDVGTGASATVSPSLRLVFEQPVYLAKDTQYIIAVGRTDSTDAYALPVQYPVETGGHSWSRYLPKGSGRIAKAAPASGDTINFAATAVVRIGVEWSWV